MTNANEDQAIAQEIRYCMQNGCEGFFLLYQPVFSPDGEKPVGAEALLRWRSPEFGELTPNLFLADIEQEEGFRDLGYWILYRAMTDGRLLLGADPNFTVCVNVSPPQITDPDFAAQLEGLAEMAEFPLSRLQLETTRNCRLLPLDALSAFAEPLHALGVKIGIDDFGSGDAWLESLKALKADYVKFSAEFTQSAGTNETDRQALRHLSEVARTYRSDIFFKAVESQETADALTDLTVQGAQGWFFSEAIYFDEVLAWIGS